MSLRITSRAFPDCGEWTIWTPLRTMYGPLMRAMGSARCRRAKLICRIPLINKGIFWTYGNTWTE